MFFLVSTLSLAIECESCGRPMAAKEDHGGQNPDNPYCVHCTDLKGKLLPFEKKYEDMVNFAMQTRWMNREQAKKSVLEEMFRWPAWHDKAEQMLKSHSQ